MVTHAEPPSRTPEQRTSHSIVVGVDSRGRSVSALVWAVDEAERTHRTLTLVSARSAGDTTAEVAGEHDLGALSRRLTLTHVRHQEVVAEPVDALLQAARDTDLLVVSCRATRPAQRLLLGSTSQTLACWSPVPLVVVPEAWMQPSLASAPLVVGIRPSGDDREVLDFAFARAAVLRVPLVVVCSGDEPEDALHRRLEPWRAAHPEVEVVARSVADRPDRALVETSRFAQMVVVGRHHSTSLGGVLGSTARRVLNGANRPVAVVPAGTREALVRDLDLRAASAGLPWAPTLEGSAP